MHNSNDFLLGLDKQLGVFSVGTVRDYTMMN
eukprot:CAMPEP_0116891992 /NCGR_PEP_ID=MMETSP0467-20121206/2303_1 /TAXON_ID=283647 /ORGANISM="Mesodinium pulex, Strain SPMC105" /LENGTH=30 /DNA_ID= /DNA_START= /DNA_END= /DNA_ORIENTATION=